MVDLTLMTTKKEAFFNFNETPIEKIKRLYNTHKVNSKLKKDWLTRNLDHGDVFFDALQVQYILFQQCIFVEETPEIIGRLEVIGFKILKGFPDEGLYEDFSYILYSEKHNLAISLYDKKHEKIIKQSVAIAEVFTEFTIARDIFAQSMKVLLK